MKIKGTWNFQAPKSLLFKTQSLSMTYWNWSLYSLLNPMHMYKDYTKMAATKCQLTLNLIGSGMSHDQMSHMSWPLRVVSYLVQSLYACADQCFGLIWMWIKASIMICSSCKVTVSLQKTYNTAVESYEFISHYLRIPLELQSPGAGFKKNVLHIL